MSAVPQSKIGAVLRVTSGNFLEQFDFFLFGFYATDIAGAFFPAGSEFASLMMTFAVFGAGFLMRPLGAVVLGTYIDKVGRRKGLIVTLAIMASGTVLIAFVPGFATIGWFAPILVLAGRLLQGFSAGAELGGVSVYLAELASAGHKGFYAAWQSASQQVSIMVAAALGFELNEHMESAALAAWGWRIPFLVGCAIIPLIFILRRSLRETDAYAQRQHHPTTREVAQTMRRNWRTVLGGMLLVSMTTTTFYLITVYTPTFGKTVLHLSARDSLLVTLLVAALTELMPLEVRVVGFALAYSLATAVFGGFTPAISTWLIAVSGDKAAPAYWLGVAAVCGFLAAWRQVKANPPSSTHPRMDARGAQRQQ